MTKIANIKPEVLQAQIEGFSNFDQQLFAGKDLKAALSAAGAKDGEMLYLDPAVITVLEGYNPRVHNKAYFEGIAVLADNMTERGFMKDKPLAVYLANIDGVDKIVLQDGHRRHAGVTLAIANGAGIKAVPVIFKEKTENTIDLTLALLHSNEGQPFTTYEKAVLAKRLKNWGMTNAQIAKEMRCTTTFVGQMLHIAAAPATISKLVSDGNLSASEAYNLMMKNGYEQAENIAKAASAAAPGEKLSAKDLTPSERKGRNAKKHGEALYKLLLKLLKNDKVCKAMSNEEHEDTDALLAVIEKVPAKKKEPKPKAEPKPVAAKKVPAAKKAPAKKAPLAAKVAVAAKKAAPAKKVAVVKGETETTGKGETPATKAEPPKGFFEQLDSKAAADKASKEAAKKEG